MQELKQYRKIESKIISDPKEILKHLQIGISIPILQEFEQYILGDIEAYNAKAIILEEDMDKERFKGITDNIVGITLVYDDGGDTLFFGFCGTYDHSEEKIEILVEKILEYAKNNEYKIIRGPINVPTVIFGWGFMVEGSCKDLFVGCPVNPPIYQKTFLRKDFYVKFEEDRYDVIVFKMDPHKLKGKDGKTKYDFSDYDHRNPGKEGILEDIEEMIDLHFKYMPPSAQITPKIKKNANNLVDFIFKYGNDGMMWTVYHKSTGKMVACGYIIPNPFSRDKRGRADSASFHDWVVHPDHQRRGLAMLMYGTSSLIVYRKGLRWGSWPVGAENEANAGAAKKMGGKKNRTHLILEYKL